MHDPGFVTLSPCHPFTLSCAPCHLVTLPVHFHANMKTALTIGGSDPSGGAGIQADLKTFSVLGVYGMSVITSVTVQNTLGVKDSLEIAPELVRRQIDTVVTDIQADACKTGML